MGQFVGGLVSEWVWRVSVTLYLVDTIATTDFAQLPYNVYFLRLEIFAIWALKRSNLIFAFLIFAIPFNRKK